MHFNLLLPYNIDLSCFEPSAPLESRLKRALTQGTVPSAFGHRKEPRLCYTGAYIHGKFAGLRLSTRQHELIGVFLVAVVRGLSPDLQFSTVALSRNMRAGVHRDQQQGQELSGASKLLSRWRALGRAPEWTNQNMFQWARRTCLSPVRWRYSNTSCISTQSAALHATMEWRQNCDSGFPHSTLCLAILIGCIAA